MAADVPPVEYFIERRRPWRRYLSRLMIAVAMLVASGALWYVLTDVVPRVRVNQRVIASQDDLRDRTHQEDERNVDRILAFDHQANDDSDQEGYLLLEGSSERTLMLRDERGQEREVKLWLYDWFIGFGAPPRNAPPGHWMTETLATLQSRGTIVQGGFELDLDETMNKPGTIILGPHVPDPADPAAFNFDLLRLDDAAGDPAGLPVSGFRHRVRARLRTDGTIRIVVDPVERVRLKSWTDPIDTWVERGRTMPMPELEVLHEAATVPAR